MEKTAPPFCPLAKGVHPTWLLLPVLVLPERLFDFDKDGTLFLLPPFRVGLRAGASVKRVRGVFIQLVLLAYLFGAVPYRLVLQYVVQPVRGPSQWLLGDHEVDKPVHEMPVGVVYSLLLLGLRRPLIEAL